MVKIGATRLPTALWAGLFLAAFLGGCITSSHHTPQPSGIEGHYAPHLARQYQMMAALFEVNGYYGAAKTFNSRIHPAMRGYWARPVLPVSGDGAQEEAREMLQQALLQAMNEDNALWLARAQVNYECWVETGMEKCRQDFAKAMDGVTIPEELLQTHHVYFEADSSRLSEGAYETLAALATALRMNKMVTLRLAGSTDYQDRNASLALRRGIAVRNMLVQMGVPLDRMVVEGEDHSDTLLGKQTPENTADTQKRRVDITLQPAFGRRAGGGGAGA